VAFHNPLLSLLKRRALDSHSVKSPQTITSFADGALSSKLVYTFPLVFIFFFETILLHVGFKSIVIRMIYLKKLHLHEAKKD